MTHSCRTIRNIRLASCFGFSLIYVFFMAAAPLSWADPGESLRKDLVSLKLRFESKARQNPDPRILSCLALETTAASWTLAVTALTEDEDVRQEWNGRLAEFEKSWDESANWDERHLAALALYYDAMYEVVLCLVTKNSQAPLAAELRMIADRAEIQLKALENRDDVALEKQVVLSNAMVHIGAVAVKSLGGGPMHKPARLLVLDSINKAELVNQRPDIHYRAKLSLLYAGNIQVLTSMVFLMGRSAGPQLSREMAALESTLKRYGQEAGVNEAMGLTWTAHSQASLPLTYWLATH